VVLLIWVYYTAQLVLMGAEFTNRRAGPLHSMLPTIDIREPMQERVAAFVVGSGLGDGCSMTEGCCCCSVLERWPTTLLLCCRAGEPRSGRIAARFATFRHAKFLLRVCRRLDLRLFESRDGPHRDRPPAAAERAVTNLLHHQIASLAPILQEQGSKLRPAD
jgi:hypothetical protein